MLKLKTYQLVALLVLMHFSVFAQTSDFESWTDIALRKKINKKLSFDLEESIRMNHNSSTIKSLNTDIGAEYELNENIELKATYRLSMRKRPNGYFSKHRGNIDVTAKNSFNQLKISLRNRTQVEKDSYINEQLDLYPKYESRNRLKLLYNIRGVKTDPFFAIEVFHSLSRWEFYKIFETRYQLGVTRDLRNKIKLDIGIIYKREHKRTIENLVILNIALKKSI